MDAAELIQQLQLEPHIEGGYFRRTYQSEIRFTLQQEENTAAQRHLLTSIFYLLSHDSPVGFLHRNRSDILHFFQLGDPIEYLLISPQGALQRVVLGNDLASGQQLQLCVPGHTWKASRLLGKQFGLISEAVAPGFEYGDMEIATSDTLRQLPQQHCKSIRPLIKP